MAARFAFSYACLAASRCSSVSGCGRATSRGTTGQWWRPQSVRKIHLRNRVDPFRSRAGVGCFGPVPICTRSALSVVAMDPPHRSRREHLAVAGCCDVVEPGLSAALDESNRDDTRRGNPFAGQVRGRYVRRNQIGGEPNAEENAERAVPSGSHNDSGVCRHRQRDARRLAGTCVGRRREKCSRFAHQPRRGAHAGEPQLRQLLRPAAL